MSITFSPEFRDTDVTGWNVTHYIDGDVHVISGPYADYDEARMSLLEHDARCEARDCAAYGGEIAEVKSGEMAGAPGVTMANDDALLLMRALGFLTDDSTDEDIWDGPSSCAAEDFLGRVLLAEAASPLDEGVPAYDDTRQGGPRWIECGRRPGCLQERLAELRDLAEYCRARGREVTWG